MTDEIETLLQAMPLAKPPASLDARIRALQESALAAEAKAALRRRRFWALGILGGGLAAAAALVLAWGFWPAEAPNPGTLPPEASTVAKAMPTDNPVRVEQNWSEVSYDGLVFPDDQTPMQKFRRQTLEHVQWIDARNGVRMETTRPKEDIILLSAPLQ